MDLSTGSSSVDCLNFWATSARTTSVADNGTSSIGLEVLLDVVRAEGALDCKLAGSAGGETVTCAGFDSSGFRSLVDWAELGSDVSSSIASYSSYS